MKEFSKWWEKHRASAGPHTWASSRGENLAMLADKEIWQAALEWIKYAGVLGPSLANDLIDEELEE